ncbi:MAG: superoxide dismutase family protein [Gammaproteobacteria bacterium]|nr:superoxide dismutase family protein [Gammaproteobacteria bacterium]
MFRKLVFFAMGAVLPAGTAMADEMQPAATAVFINPAGETIGEASLWQGPHGVLIHVDVAGLSPGKHAIHLHAVGACKPDFGASGGHINPDGAKHGLLNPEGPDKGDLPNIYASDAGKAQAELYTTAVYVVESIAGAAPLLDGDGSALVIHAKGDDHVTQPIGGAGGRVGCGVIVPAP